jgi:hypothetical protein
MFEYINGLLDELELLIKRFFNIDARPGNSWQRQPEPASGSFGASRGGAKSYGEQHSHSTQVRKYTPEEVQRCLRGLERGERVGPVMAQAGQLGSLLNDGMRRYFRGRERIFERLPYVLFQYTQGKPSQEIARSVSYFSDADDIEEAMWFVARLIAARINRMR